jgi:hypothetical protein
MNAVDSIENTNEERVQQVDIVDSSAQLLGISQKIKLIN